jgi:predicted PurR-regulated permease PerM
MVGGLKIDRSRFGWWLVGLALGAAVLYVVYSFIGTFVFGVFLYYATRPVYKRLRRRIRPASLAAMTALLALALPVLLLMAYTGAIGLQEFNNIADSSDIDGLQTTIQPYLDVSTIAQRPDELLANPDPALLSEIGRSALQYIGFIGNAVLHLFVMIAIAFYLLRDDHRLSRFARRQFSDEGGVVEAYGRAVDRDFNSIFFGNILNALLTGTIGAASYNMLNLFAPTELVVPYPTLLGLLTGAASLIPIVGMKLVYFPVSAYLGLNTAIADPAFLWFPALFFGVSLVIVDTIPDLVLRPYVSGRNLHVGLVMLAYIFGPLLFGWYGIFFGPMILVLVVHFVRIVLPELVVGERIRPWAVDPTYLFEPETPPTQSEEFHTSDTSGTGPNAESTGDSNAESSGTSEDEGGTETPAGRSDR